MNFQHYSYHRKIFTIPIFHSFCLVKLASSMNPQIKAIFLVGQFCFSNHRTPLLLYKNMNKLCKSTAEPACINFCLAVSTD